MREVYLTPEHSKWWLLSPGVTIYYDRLKICKSDFEKVQKEAGNSSYHDQIALHLDAFISRDDYPEIEIIDDAELGLTENYQNRSEVLKNLLYRRAGDENDTTLTPREIVKLTIDAFEHWIDYNKGKVRYLRKDEPYRGLLGGDLIPEWEKRRSKLIEIYNSPENEILDRFSEDKDSQSTFKRLLASCSRCIDLIDSGKQIYDPMLVEYLPVIQIIEGKRVSNRLMENRDDISSFFEAYRIQMSRYTDILPININLREVAKSIASYQQIRTNLERLDSTIKSITDSDLRSSVTEIENEIGNIVRETRNISKTIGYGFWISGIIWTIASALGCPDFASRIKSVVTTAHMMGRGVGRFAGAYSLITDRIILQQDSTISSTHYHDVDYDYFRKHYWDFGSKSV